MQSINIYIETSIKSPNKQQGSYGYLLEAIINSMPVTRLGLKTIEKTTSNELILIALETALNRVVTPCIIVIHTGCFYLYSTFQHGWLEEWVRNNWRNKKGKEIAHLELWKSIAKKCNQHKIQVTFVENHQYKEMLINQLARENK